VRYGYFPAERRFVGLIVVTVIFVWLFTAMILSTWPLTNKLDLQTLKYILVGLLSSVILYFIIAWTCYLYSGCNTSDRMLIRETLKKDTRKYRAINC
jgi:hypothetical protein